MMMIKYKYNVNFLRVYNLTISIAIGWVSLIFMINYFIAKYILKFKNQLTVHLK